MRKHVFEAQTDVPVESLWSVVADIGGWPESDTQIEYVDVKGPVGEGTQFILKPKGGPKLQMTVEAFNPPGQYVDRCKLPLGAMRTAHEFLPIEDGAKIRVTIEMLGPLGELWWHLVGKQHAQGLPAQTERFISQARKQGQQGLKQPA